MEILNKLHKHGPTKRITTWTLIYLFLFQLCLALEDNSFSSGIDETTTFAEPTTHITLTPILSTASTTTNMKEPTTTNAPEPPNCHAQTQFIESGPQAGDTEFPIGDDNYIFVCPSIEVPINSRTMGCIYISTNGYITNANSLLPFTPAKDVIVREKINLFPFWSDIDTRFGGRIYYRIYDVYNQETRTEDKTKIGLIEELFARYELTSKPKWALKITWDNVKPYQTTGNETMTFQFILATNGAITNMAYIYDDCKTTFLDTRLALMGYTYPGYSYFFRDSLNSGIFELGTQTNRKDGAKGVWIFELSKQYKRNAAQQCLEWADSTVRTFDSPFSVSCPCTLWQARRDFRFSRGPNRCFYLTFPSPDYSKVCCYLRRGGWRWRTLSRGYVQLYSAILNRNLWRKEDRTPYRDCCIDSDYCGLYSEYRPMDFCFNYRPPIRRFMFGDPHIQTLDGFVYTFNGLGEFELLNIKNGTQNLINIQCRTNETGSNGRKATVFTAFAIRSENITLQISERQSREDVKIFANEMELTQFYSDKNFTWNKGPFLLSSKPDENDTYVIQHKSQTVIEISLKTSLLQLSINIGYKGVNITTDGLLGTFNQNTSDDLTTPVGKVISTNSTDEVIYYQFGMLWKVNQSIFHYETTESAADYDFPNFVPTFLEINTDSEEYKNAVKLCGIEEADCIHDYLITNDTNLSQNTKNVEIKIDYNKRLAGLSSPTIVGNNNITVNINELAVRSLAVTGGNGSLELAVVNQENCNISLTNRNVEISIQLTQANPVIAAFHVSDSYNMSTPLVNITVMVCPYCYTHGKCDKSAFNTLKPYEYACSCNKGWRGAYCDIDARCDPLNCPCTGPDNNYTCTCPAGYTFKDKCVDINECDVSKPCSQICTNTIGNFSCSCNDGYTLVNNTQCVDKDECDLLDHKCEHKCINTIGSYNCSCYPGYILNGRNCTKDPQMDVCQNKTDCSNATGCTLINTQPTCFCKTGYTFNTTTKSCDDIDECANITCINGQCENSEGSYACTCPVGRKLAKDSRTCEECGRNKWGKDCANTCSGGNCLECNKTTGCVCAPGFEGSTCDIDIDECKIKNYCNATYSTCKNTVGSVTCACNAGFILDASGSCIDEDECANDNACSSNSVCVNTFGSYICHCNSGYRGDGRNCTDINECLVNNTCDHNCVNQDGSYSCTCNETYKLLDDRASCEKISTGLSYEERLYIILIGSIVGAIVVGLFITLWCCCFGCVCCGRRRRPVYSTFNDDTYNLRGAFGSLTSTLRGRFLHEPLATDSAKAAKYLEDWSNFSPYSENNRQDNGIDNEGWEDFGEGSSSWGNVLTQYDNTREFRLERPKFRQ